MRSSFSGNNEIFTTRDQGANNETKFFKLQVEFTTCALSLAAAFLLGAIMAAVSPAVIVPCLFRLRGKGYGVSKGIPTLVLAVSGVDDAASVAIFGIVSSIMFSSSSLTMNIIQVSSIKNILFRIRR